MKSIKYLKSSLYFLLIIPIFTCFATVQPILVDNQTQFNAYFGAHEFPQNAIEKVSPKKCRIWLIRHGESESNAAITDKDKIRIAGRTIDSPLSQKGKEQADGLARIFQEHSEKFDVYYTSPLSRAVDTSLQIKNIMEEKPLSKESILVEELLETYYGSLEGSDGHAYDPIEAEMKKALPLLSSFQERMDYRMVPDMESNREVFLRIERFVNDVAKDHLGQTICMTTHNGPLKAVFMHLAVRDFDAEILYHVFSVGNCAAICLESDGEMLQMKRFHKINMRK